MTVTRNLSPSTSTSSGLSDFDRVWESSLSQLQSQSQQQISRNAPKRRRLLSPARSDTSLGFGTEILEEKEMDALGSEGDVERGLLASGGEAEEADEDEDEDELDGLQFSDSLSLTSYTPPLPECWTLLDDFELLPGAGSLSLQAGDDDEVGGGVSDVEGPASSSEDSADKGSSEEEADNWDFSLASVAAADVDQPVPDDQVDSVAPMSQAERREAAKAYVEDLLIDTLRQISTQVRRRLGESEVASDDEDDLGDPAIVGRSSRGRLALPYGGPDDSFVWPRRRGIGSNTKQLARIWKVLALVHQGLATESSSTKRELFYADPGLFGSQTTVDKIIDGIINASGLMRGDFNVTASPKGLFASSIIDLALVDDEATISSAGKATVIPPREKIAKVVLRDESAIFGWSDEVMLDEPQEPRLILVIEKDATFQALCESKWGEGQVVLITGKGFPDLSTRQFLSLLARRFQQTPVFGLFDGDPDGIEILSTYKFGSRAQANSAEESDLPVERMEWLGVKPSEWGKLNIDRDLMLPLTERDLKKIVSMLARPAQRLPQEWRKELCHMQHLRRKAEIQLLQSTPAAVASSPEQNAALGSIFESAVSGPAQGPTGIDRLVAYLDERTALNGEESPNGDG